MRNVIGPLCITALLLCSPAWSQQPSFTKGLAQQTDPGLFNCGRSARVSAVGTITSEDGNTWTVPADTHFKSAPKAADLYNACVGHMPDGLSEIDIDGVPLLDAGGHEVFIAFIFADNYFELYVNGKLLAVDPVPFTPFNASVVRFRANRPVTLAMALVDWEENLGLGSEKGRGSSFHPGDGGLTMLIRGVAGETVALTDETWRAQTYYIAPLKDRSCLKITGVKRDSSACDTTGARDGTTFSAAHWAVPAGWMSPDFDDSSWPMATTYSNETVGVRGKASFTNFRDVFDAPGTDAKFIWSSNLVLDNLVLVRKTID